LTFLFGLADDAFAVAEDREKDVPLFLFSGAIEVVATVRFVFPPTIV
jgi:hypothetical protein